MSENSGPEQSPARLAFVSIKWGRHFSPDYVNVLHHHVSRNVSRKHRFICVTDDAAGLHPAIETIPLPDLNLSEKRSRLGRWQKLALFKVGLLPDVDVAIYMDLDTMVLDSLDQLVDHVIGTPGFHILREWNPAVWNVVPVRLRPDRGGQSSILGWRPSDQHRIFDEFVRDPEEVYRQVSNDQGHITRTAEQLRYLPHQFCVSFKRHCVAHYPLNLIFKTPRKPRRAPIVVFHGRPRPTDLLQAEGVRWGTKYRFGFEPVDWVQRYWEEGRGRLRDVRKN
jgi:hypothetical protein